MTKETNDLYDYLPDQFDLFGQFLIPDNDVVRALNEGVEGIVFPCLLPNPKWGVSILADRVGIYFSCMTNGLQPYMIWRDGQKNANLMIYVFDNQARAAQFVQPLN